MDTAPPAWASCSSQGPGPNPDPAHEWSSLRVSCSCSGQATNPHFWDELLGTQYTFPSMLRATCVRDDEAYSTAAVRTCDDMIGGSRQYPPTGEYPAAVTPEQCAVEWDSGNFGIDVHLLMSWRVTAHVASVCVQGSLFGATAMLR